MTQSRSLCVCAERLLFVPAILVLTLAGCTATNRATRDAAKMVAARQLTLRGMDAVEQDDWDTAEQLFREAVAASPHDERAHLQFSKALWHRGERSEAVTHMREAARLSGNAPELLVELGRMQLALGDLDGARRSGFEAAQADRQYAAAHALVGDVLARQGRLDQALESYHLALSLDARQPEILLSVAEIYKTWDEPRRILSTLNSIVADELPAPLAGQTYYLRGIAENRLQRHQDAVDDLVKAAEQLPLAPIYYELAGAYQKTGQLDAAKLALQSALERDPNHDASRTLLAQLNSIPNLANGTTYQR